MIDKALLIMLFMWTISFTTLGMQFVMGDLMGIELTIQCSDGCEEYGQPFKPAILGWITDGNINQITERAVGGNYGDSSFDRFVQFTVAAAYVGWDIVLLLTGTYIFTFLYYMGIPSIFVTGIALVYAILLIRAVVGYIRGV